MLSCLHKDPHLSHALTVALGTNLPFSIGRDSTQVTRTRTHMSA